MNISSQNIIDYLMFVKFKEPFSNLKNFLFEKGSLELLNLSNRNTLVSIKIRDKKYFLKQPRQVINGASWPIINEARFYNLLCQNTTQDYQFFFDKQRNVLILPFLDILDKRKIIGREDLIIDVSKHLKDFHENFKLDKQSINLFAEKYCTRTSNQYKDFISQLINGYESESFLDEIVFVNFKNPKSLRFKLPLYNLLKKEDIYKGLQLIYKYNSDECLIHCDIKLPNIANSHKGIKFIDFELVSIGDPAWDLACFVDSILFEYFQKNRNYALGIDLTMKIIQNYGNLNPEFLNRFLLFLALKKIDRFRISILEIGYFKMQLNAILSIFSNSPLIVDYIEKNKLNDRKAHLVTVGKFYLFFGSILT